MMGVGQLRSMSAAAKNGLCQEVSRCASRKPHLNSLASVVCLSGFWLLASPGSIVYTEGNNRRMIGHRTRKVRAIPLVREPVAGANRRVGPRKLPREP